MLETKDYGLVINVYYSDLAEKTNNFTSVLFNSTVDLYEAEGGFDAQEMFAYLALVAVLGLIGFILYRNLSSWTKRMKRRPSKQPAQQAGANTIDNDWLVGTAADPNLRSRKNSKKGGKK
eukprot:TRINITY_DN217_c0_g1_i1.p1 TRINITY_DN217_c0_g1~~TRINITY_DN217_c0_g1_i1.p1  ORF type:complete len:120 (+),score=22.53 TRINITY_DN217_c0_g1_i1:162-521(+)